IGVPAIYYHSLLGSGQDRVGMEQSDIARRINREVLDADVLEQELTSSARRSGMLEGLRHLLTVRRALPGFSPFADQEVVHLDDRVLVIRRAPNTEHEVTAAVNVSGDTVTLPSLSGQDAISGLQVDGLTLDPYGYAWLIGGTVDS
ncbi:MAG: alpha-amylase, partial [Microbacterium aurum]